MFAARLRKVCLGILAAVFVLWSFSDWSIAAEKADHDDLSLAMGQARLFEALTDIERDILRSAATLHKCKEAEIIIKQGKPLERMFIILEGQAEIRVNGEVVATLPEGSLVGEVEFLDKLPASADVVVLRESTLIELNNARLANLMEMNPRLGYVLMSEIARTEGQRLRAMDQR